MKYIQLSITSDIIGIREGIPEERKDVICMPITDEAAEVAAELNNLREDCRLSAIRDGDGCIMTLAGKEDKRTVDLTLLSRLEKLSKIWNVRENVHLQDLGDMAVSNFMEDTFPIWRVESFTAEASALIANARIDEDAVIPYPVFFRCADNQTPLFLNVMELIYIPDMNLCVTTHMITPSSGVRFLNVFNTGAGLMERETMHFIRAYFAVRECDRTPLVVSNPQEAKNTRRGIHQTQGISRYRISLTKRYKGRKLYQGANYKEGKSLTIVSVSGYVRNQPYGPGRTRRKTIWVDGFMRGQWVKSGITYVTVTD